MSRKFTIKVAGCEWRPSKSVFDLRYSYTLYALGIAIGFIQPYRDGWDAGALTKSDDRKQFGHMELDQAKAYVIKQLAGAGKEKR